MERACTTKPFHFFTSAWLSLDHILRLLSRRMSANEESVRDKLGPTISYLQKLGPDQLQQIFDAARWLFTTDPDMAFEVNLGSLANNLIV
jgi:hypothetical protein